MIPIVFQMYPTSFLAIRRGENQIEATEMCRSVLEDYRSRPFASLQPGELDLGDQEGAGKVVFHRHLSLRAVSPRTVELRVRVEWTVRRKTYVSEHALYVSKVRP